MFFRNDNSPPGERSKGGKVLPLLPLRDIIVFPHMVVPLFVGREKSIAAVDPAGYAALVGRYRVDLADRHVDFDVTVAAAGDGRRLLITRVGGKPSELLPLSEMQFFSRDTGNEFTFTREKQLVTTLLIDQQGQRFTARRMP